MNLTLRPLPLRCLFSHQNLNFPTEIDELFISKSKLDSSGLLLPLLECAFVIRLIFSASLAGCFISKSTLTRPAVTTRAHSMPTYHSALQWMTCIIDLVHAAAGHCGSVFLEVDYGERAQEIWAFYVWCMLEYHLACMSVTARSTCVSRHIYSVTFGGSFRFSNCCRQRYLLLSLILLGTYVWHFQVPVCSHNSEKVPIGSK